MIDIYICEDDPKQLAYIQSKIQSFIDFDMLDMQIVIATKKPEEILIQAEKRGNCGLYFLDIDLHTPGLDGVLLAQKIRKIEPRCFIVFVTSHFELSFRTYKYKVEALDFIVKENPEEMKDKIHECMLNAYEKHTTGANQNIFTATMPNGRQIAVNLDEIVSFEMDSVTHRVILNAKNRVFDFPDQLNNVEKRLKDDFFRCHRSAIINLKNVTEANYSESTVKMCNGQIFPISLRKKSALKNALKG